MYDIHQLSKDIVKLKNQNEFEDYLESNFIEIEEYLLKIDDGEIDSIKFDIEDMLYDMIDYKLILDKNSITINAFLILLSEKFLQTSLIGSITIISNYLPSGATKLRLEAAKLYLKVNDISKDYSVMVPNVLELLERSADIDEYHTKAIKSFLFFMQSAVHQFKRVNNEDYAKKFIHELIQKKQNFRFLQDISLVEFFIKLANADISKLIMLINEHLGVIGVHRAICSVKEKTIEQESGTYAKALKDSDELTFESIRNISYQYTQSIGNPQELYDRLQRGEKIIDDEQLLYKYLASFGRKHKLKLDSAYDLIIDKIKDKKFDIVDWGCGQATATIALLDYANQCNIQLGIENITLIEPSILALKRGLLHIDVLKQKEYNINPINSDLDCLDSSDIKQSNNKTLHLFSNILDIESFSLDNQFFKKVSAHINNDAIFVCISPNRNDKLNNRLELFYSFFDENFDTELISSRDSDIGNATRYEKIFEVRYVKEAEVQEKRHEIEVLDKSYNIDIIDELSNYNSYVVPILDMKILEDSINSDPEYAIFKIRKVAEVITSKIYAKYEDNGKSVSFNDKIRYLSYEKKLFDKTITNYVHTLRTIGNRGVHEDDRALSKLKFDAHLMVIALISYLQELIDRKLID